jgi:hypothetical protein
LANQFNISKEKVIVYEWIKCTKQKFF